MPETAGGTEAILPAWLLTGADFRVVDSFNFTYRSDWETSWSRADKTCGVKTSNLFLTEPARALQFK